MIRKVLSIVISGTNEEQIRTTVNSINNVSNKNKIEVILAGNIDKKILCKIKHDFPRLTIKIVKYKYVYYYYRCFARKWQRWLKKLLSRLIMYKTKPYMEPEDGGINHGFFQGIHKANGKYIMPMHQGWQLTKDFWENSIEIILENDVDRLFSYVKKDSKIADRILDDIVGDGNCQIVDGTDMVRNFHLINGYGNALIIVRNKYFFEKSKDIYPMELFDKLAYNAMLLKDSRTEKAIMQNKKICFVENTYSNSKEKTGEQYFDQAVLYISYLQERIWTYRVYGFKDKKKASNLEVRYCNVLKEFIDRIRILSDYYKDTDTEISERFIHLYNALKEG